MSEIKKQEQLLKDRKDLRGQRAAENSDFGEIEYMDTDFLVLDGAVPVKVHHKTALMDKPESKNAAPTHFRETNKYAGSYLTPAREVKEATEETVIKDEELTVEHPGEGAADIHTEEPAPPLHPRQGKEFIELEEEIVERIPDNFEMSNIGSVDLREAEEIANETLLVINEKEILDGLEEMRDLFMEQKKITAGDDSPEVFDIALDLHDSKPVAPKPADSKDAGAFRSKGVQKDLSKAFAVGRGEPVKVAADTPAEPRKEKFGDLASGYTGGIVNADIGTPAADAATTGREPHGAIFDIEVFADSGTASAPGRSSSPVTQPEKNKAPSGEVEIYGRENEAVPLQERIDRSDAGTSAIPPVKDERQIPIEKMEKLPQQDVSRTEGAVFFIDDLLVERSGTDARDALEVDDLEKITSQLVDINVGAAMSIPEGDMISEEYMPLATEMRTLQEDFVFEFVDDFKYRDDELDFINTSISEDDYSKYLQEIDEFQTVKGAKGTTRAVELFGLTAEELSEINNDLFGAEYKDIDLSEIFDFFKEDSVKRGLGPSIAKECIYIVPNADSLMGEDRSSIEEDISSVNALVFEENTDDIINLLGKAPKDEIKGKVELVEEIRDITDRVVIIDDDDDIDRFVREFPDKKRGGLKKLLKYLDGLFEKLPESTVKTFANSEYFDLYLKVMDDLDV